MTRDEKVKPWPFFGYAPGNYVGTCSLGCGETMLDVDKRAMRCLTCAVVAAKQALSTIPVEEPTLLRDSQRGQYPLGPGAARKEPTPDKDESPNAFNVNAFGKPLA